MQGETNDSNRSKCEVIGRDQLSKDEINEKRKKKVLQIRSATSVYIAKCVALLGVAVIAIVTSSSEKTLLLGTLTFVIGIIFDMLVLSKSNPLSDIWWIILVQWLITIIIGVVAFVVAIILLIYNSFQSETKLFIDSIINSVIPKYMIAVGILGPLLEIYYNIPYDD